MTLINHHENCGIHHAVCVDPEKCLLRFKLAELEATLAQVERERDASRELCQHEVDAHATCLIALVAARKLADDAEYLCAIDGRGDPIFPHLVRDLRASAAAFRAADKEGA